NTNDAFTGLDAVRLTGGTKTYRVFAYDAGSEVNDQLRASIPGPCCGDMSRGGMTENLAIRHHEGILANTGDLTPDMWGWPVHQAVALITVERIRE
ncbi:MAG: spondin domain-containing protein, partial [Candidatus Eisenbacteria bacterium]